MMGAKIQSFFSPSSQISLTRIFLVTGLLLVLYLSTLLGLFYAWYSQEAIVPFHWFDDSAEWLLMDKLGHLYTTFVECFLLLKLWSWTGASKRTSMITSAYLALFAQSSYEIFDGLSPSYGASYFDMIANAIGALLFMIQILWFHKLQIFPKFSFHPSLYAHLRPSFFGNSIFTQIIKDYNGQTYWFSMDLNGLLKRKVMPSWLLISIGFGAEGMLGGHDNSWTTNSGDYKDYSHIPRTRKIIFSIDFNWENIERKQLRWAKYIFSFIKVPAPAIEVNFQTGLRFHWIYF